MSTKDSGSLQHDPTTHLDGPYIEPLAQGGRRYYRCPNCNREVLADGVQNLDHAPDCQHT